LWPLPVTAMASPAPAASQVVITGGGVAGFAMDAVARQAGVARMTVYHQFGSKRGPLEALFDDLAARGLVERLRGAFGRPDPLDALADVIAAFGGFWASERLGLHPIRGLAALDPDFEQGVRAHDERRRGGLRVLLGRLAEERGRPAASSLEEAVDILHTLTSFETFDALAGTTRGPEEVVPLMHRLARGTRSGRRMTCAGGLVVRRRAGNLRTPLTNDVKGVIAPPVNKPARPTGRPTEQRLASPGASAYRPRD
jgi:AcrR family transcriptional regulator